jgi:hypothetical protein
MKKAIRFIAGVILFVVAAFLILGLIMPKDVVVSRSVMINAPKNVVFDQMSNFKNWTNWSPWIEKEPTVKLTYKGADGAVGSGYHWVGEDKNTGTGDMNSLAINGTKMDFEVKFSKPMKREAQGTLEAMDTAGATKAYWSFSMHMPYPFNAMLLFMNMDKMLGGDFEKGLNNMKKYAESHAGSALEIKEVEYPAKKFLCIKETVGWGDMGKFFGEKIPVLIKDAGAKMCGPVAGIYFTWDTVKKCTDMACAIPVTDKALKMDGTTYLDVPTSKAVMAAQKGGYSKSMEVHESIKKYMDAKGLQQQLVIEEYLVTQHEEPDSNKWVTNVYYLLK